MTASKLIINGEEQNLGGTRRYRTLEVDRNIIPQGNIVPLFNRGDELCCKITDDLGEIKIGDVLYIEGDGEAPSYPEFDGKKSEEESEETKGGAKIYPISLYGIVSIGIYDSNDTIQQEFYMTPFYCNEEYLIDSMGVYTYEKVNGNSPDVQFGPQNDKAIVIGELSSLKVNGQFNKFLLWSVGFTNSVLPIAEK